MKDIRKVIIPVAGWGTRSLPATKNIPKEMLPIYNKPVIQYVVEEAQKANIEDVIFVTNRDKSVIEDHFDYNLQLESVLERAGKLEKLAEVRKVAEMVNIMSVRQKKQLGLGHAVWCARDIIGNEPFALLLPDVLVKNKPSGLKQMIDAANADDVFHRIRITGNAVATVHLTQPRENKWQQRVGTIRAFPGIATPTSRPHR